MILAGNVSRPKWQPIFRQLGYMGLLLCPCRFLAPWCEVYACDNDAFAHSHLPHWWEEQGEGAWLKMLDKLAAFHAPTFVLLPDVVGDWTATLERSAHYREEVRDRGLPMALALQDGCDYAEALAFGPDWVFVGGTTDWKLANIEPACCYFHPLGIKVHVGRVNGRRRLQACLRNGVESCDGTGWAKFSDVEIPRLDRTMTNWKLQLRFEEMA